MSEIAQAQRSLGELEAVIERGLTTFVDVGSALLEIRDRRLYRETHGNFDRYCQERWGFSRDRGDQMIAAARVVSELPTMVGNELPINERQARELARIPDPAERAGVWVDMRNTHGERVTAAQIRERREETMLPIVDLETGEIVGEARPRPARREVPELNVRPTRRIDDWEGAARERLKSEAQMAGRSTCVIVETAHDHVMALIQVFKEVGHVDNRGELADWAEWQRAAALAEAIGRTIRADILSQRLQGGGDGG